MSKNKALPWLGECKAHDNSSCSDHDRADCPVPITATYSNVVVDRHRVAEAILIQRAVAHLVDVFSRKLVKVEAIGYLSKRDVGRIIGQLRLGKK